MSLAIVYVTSNREDEAFEEKIRSKLLEVAGKHPIISVSQKPIKLGHNVCLGDIGSSYHNAHIQILVGALTADTDHIAIAEADQLYPPGYFDFEPGDAEVYMYQGGLWILRYWDPSHFRKKQWGGWTTISQRQHLISRLEYQLRRHRTHTLGEIFKKKVWEYWSTEFPMISVKTPNNISTTTGTIDNSEVAELPYWGSALDLSRYLGIYE